MGDEAAAMLVDNSHDLIYRALRGMTDHPAELFLAGNNIAETMPENRAVAWHKKSLNTFCR